MPKAPKDEQRRESQSERFERTAREHGVELDEKKLAEMLRRMAKREQRDSDGKTNSGE